MAAPRLAGRRRLRGPLACHAVPSHATPCWTTSKPSCSESSRGSPSSCPSRARATSRSPRRSSAGDDPGAAYTAVIQIGAIAAVLVYFCKDISRIGWRGAVSSGRSTAGTFDHRMGWFVILGSHPDRGHRVPGQGRHRGRLRDVVGRDAAGRVERGHWFAEKRATQDRAEKQLTLPTRSCGPRPVHRPGPRRLALGRDDLGRPVPRPRSRGRHPAKPSCSHPGAGRRGTLRAQGPER